MKKFTLTLRNGVSMLWAGFWVVIGVAAGVDPEPEPEPNPQIYPMQEN